MIRNYHRLIAAGVIVALLGAGSALGQFQPPRPPADVQQAPLPPPPQQQPLPPPQPQQKAQPQQKSQPPELPPELRQAPQQPEKKATKAKQKQKDGKELPAPATTPETMTQPPEGERIANPTASFNGLDKISGRIIVFDVAINETTPGDTARLLYATGDRNPEHDGVRGSGRNYADRGTAPDFLGLDVCELAGSERGRALDL
jgi:outer membrane biosynthesis protein TonB